MLLGIEMLQVYFFHIFFHTGCHITTQIQNVSSCYQSCKCVLFKIFVSALFSRNPNLLSFFMQTFIINTLLEKLPEFMLDG